MRKIMAVLIILNIFTLTGCEMFYLSEERAGDIALVRAEGYMKERYNKTLPLEVGKVHSKEQFDEYEGRTLDLLDVEIM